DLPGARPGARIRLSASPGSQRTSPSSRTASRVRPRLCSKRADDVVRSGRSSQTAIDSTGYPPPTVQARMTTAPRTHRRSVSETRTADHSIVAIDKFIQATRDSGYKGTGSAIAELVDNSIQAGATNIEILLQKSTDDPRYPLEVRVCDDGCGMDPFTLRQA